MLRDGEAKDGEPGGWGGVGVGGARCQGEWVGPVAREEGGASGFEEGSRGYEGRRGGQDDDGRRQNGSGSRGAPNTPQTPPSQQTLRSRPVGCQSRPSGDHRLPPSHSPSIQGPWPTKVQGAVACPSRCLPPPRVARRGAAAPRRGAQATPGLPGTSRACCRWLSPRAPRSQTPRQNP